MKQSTAGEKLLKAVQILTILFLIVFLLWCFLHRDEFTIEQILHYTPENPFLAAVVLILLYALKSLTVFFFIGILMAAGGVLFSLPVALLVNVIGAAAAISVPYWIGRRRGTPYLEKLTQKHAKLAVVQNIQADNAFFTSLMVRAIGCLPCDVVSLYLGASGMHYPVYVAGGIVGFIPSILTFTLMGTSITDITSPQFLIAAGFEILFVILSCILYAIYKKEKKHFPRITKKQKK